MSAKLATTRDSRSVRHPSLRPLPSNPLRTDSSKSIDSVSMSCAGIDFTVLSNCSVAFSDLRPEQGVTIIPWVLTALLLALHVPLGFIRIIQWDKGQWFSVSLTCLEYRSTSMHPKNKYIWIPVALTADIGGALQLMILIWKEYKKHKWESVLY